MIGVVCVATYLLLRWVYPKRSWITERETSTLKELDQPTAEDSSVVVYTGRNQENDGEVQEFMERLVESIIGGGLDDVALYPLSDRPHYTNFCARYKDPLVHVLRRLYANLKMALSDSVPQDGETACDLHAELKDLMKQIIREARSHPSLSAENGETSWPPPSGTSPESLGQRSYEDILATAILNKIFSKYQQDRPRRRQRLYEKTVDRNSNLLSSKLTASMQGEVGRSESQSEDSDSITNSPDLDSWSESSHHEPLSVTIEECIEEVTTRYSSDEDEPKSELDRFLSSLSYIKRQRAPFPEFGKDIVDGGISSSDEGENDVDGLPDAMVESVTVNPVDSWEENWLFQRRKLKTSVGTCQPVPVPMLVPNPSQDLRAMIGGVDADEMSDLSDCSDSVLEDLVDGPDDKKYFESQLEDESEEEKPIEVLEKQREVFLKYISEDLNKLIEPQEMRGISPETSLKEEEEGKTVLSEVKKDLGQIADKEQSPDEEMSAVLDKTRSTGSPTETDSSNSYSVAEARNLSVPVVQVDSGEGSLDMQQEGEYTVAYATLAEVRPSPSPSPTPSPVPKPRTVLSSSTNEASEEEDTDKKTSSHNILLNTGQPEEAKDDTLSALSIPPKPGTIAEREHLKWEKAPPLANNPYSKENITRRQRQRMYLSRHSSSENSIEFPELTGTKEPSLLEIDSKHRRQDYNKYVRDYYVNVAEEREEHKQKSPLARPSTEPRTSCQLTASCPSQQQVSVKVEVEVAVSKTCPRSSVPTVTQTTAHQVTTVVTPTPDVEESYISLPSVKELAKQFCSPDEKIPTPTSPVPVRKQPEVRLHSPIRQVHSLTARNISREFRENLRTTTTVPVVKVVPGGDKELDSSGHISEDSGTVSPTPCPHPLPRRLKIQDDIQFWEQLKQQR